MTVNSQGDALFYLACIHAAATYTIKNGYNASATEAASKITQHLDPILASQPVSYLLEDTIGPTLTHIISPSGERFTLPEDQSKFWAEQFLAGGWPVAQINGAIQLLGNAQ